MPFLSFKINSHKKQRGKQVILNMRNKGKSISGTAPGLDRANATIWSVLKKKEPTGLLSNIHKKGQSRNITLTDDRSINQ